MPKYIQKRRRKWYAILEIPNDLKDRYNGKPRHFKSLDTESETVALRRAAPLVAQWKHEFESLRSNSTDPLQMDVDYWRKTLREQPEQTDDHLVSLADVAEEMGDRGIDFYKRAAGQLYGTIEFVDEWLAASGDTQKTKDMKRTDISRLAGAFGTLDMIQRKAVQRWANKLIQDGLKPKTVQRILSACRGYWKHLQGLEVVSDEALPFERLDLKKTSAKTSKQDERKPFEASDVVKLKATVNTKDKQLADLIEVAMWTGCRIEELCSLKLEKVTDHLAIEDAKTPSGWRQVPIHSRLQGTIERLKEESKDGFLISGLTVNKYGDRSNAIGKRFGRLKTEMGFKEQYVFHSIRKTVATLLDRAGVPENVAADIIGHEKPTMTYGLYSGGSDLKVMREAIEKIEYPPAPRTG